MTGTVTRYSPHGRKTEKGSRRASRRESRANRSEREEEKVLIIINAPKRFVGRQLKKGKMEPLVSVIKDILRDVE